MAVVQPDYYRHDSFVRKSIQIPSTQHKELKALAVELEASLGDVVETIMDLMRQDFRSNANSAGNRSYGQQSCKNANANSPLSVPPSMKPTPTLVPSQKLLKTRASFLLPVTKVCLRRIMIDE